MPTPGPRPAAERVRPILQAMERSISAARNRRLHAEDPVADPAADVTTPATPVRPESRPPAPNDPVDPNAPREGQPSRLKARPKRSTGFATFPAPTPR